MRVYFTAMSVRVACVASLFFVRGWWILLVGVAAVVLPYFAVLVANQHAPATRPGPEQPTPLELLGPAGDADDAREDPASSALLVVDAPAERRPSTAADDVDGTGAEATDQGASDRPDSSAEGAA